MSNTSDIVNCLSNCDSDDVSIFNLNQLSIKLRNSEERKSEQVFDYIEYILTENHGSQSCLLHNKSEEFLFDFMKVLVNFVAYNDKNRLMVSEKLTSFIDLLKHQRLEGRFLIFLDNLMIGEDNNEVLAQIYQNMYSGNLLPKIYNIILYKVDNCFISQDDLKEIKTLNFLIDFFKKFYKVVRSSQANNIEADFKVTNLFQFKKLVNIISIIESNSLQFLENDDEDDEDEDDENENDDRYIDILSNYAFLLNLESERLSIDENSVGNSVIQNMFKVFPQDIDDKQLSRFFFGSIGNVSSNLKYDNHQDIKFCLDTIKDMQSADPYLVSLAFLILGNSIENTSDRDFLLSINPNLIDDIFARFELLNVDNYFKRIIIEKQICKEINFITEPILQQSIFQLLKLIFTSNQMNDVKVLAVIQSDLENHLETLSKIILINFNSVFFSKINLQIILKLLNNLVRNFVNYNKEKSSNLNNLRWFIGKSKFVIFSLLKSIKSDISYSNDNIIEIKECNEISRGLILEFLQNLLNGWINLELPWTFEEDLFKCLFDLVLKNGYQVEDTTISSNNSVNATANQTSSITEFQGGISGEAKAKTSKNDSGMILLLSSKLITLTLIVSSIERYAFLSEYPLQAITDDCVGKAMGIIEKNQEIDQVNEQENKKSGTNMLSNNLKVFLVTYIKKKLDSNFAEPTTAAAAKYKKYLEKLM